VWSRIFLANLFTLFISFVFSSITLCNLAISIFDASFSIRDFVIMSFRVVSKERFFLESLEQVRLEIAANQYVLYSFTKNKLVFGLIIYLFI
jgi:hypothetical protein